MFDEKDDIEGINDAYWHLRAEAIPEDQLDMPEQDQLLYVYHCAADQPVQVPALVWLEYWENCMLCLHVLC